MKGVIEMYKIYLSMAEAQSLMCLCDNALHRLERLDDSYSQILHQSMAFSIVDDVYGSLDTSLEALAVRLNSVSLDLDNGLRMADDGDEGFSVWLSPAELAVVAAVLEEQFRSHSETLSELERIIGAIDDEMLLYPDDAIQRDGLEEASDIVRTRWCVYRDRRALVVEIMESVRSGVLSSCPNVSVRDMWDMAPLMPGWRG